MKKFIAVLTTIALVFALAACGRPTIPSPGQNTNNANSQNPEQQNNNQSNSGGTDNSQNDEFTVGETTETDYTNEYFGFKIEPGEDWYIATANDLAEIQVIAVDTMDNDAAQKAFDNGSAAYLFYAQNLATNENIQVIVEGLPFENLKVNQVIKNTSAALEESYKQSGYTIDKLETKDVTFDGRTETGLDIQVTSSGTQIHQQYIGIIKGKYYCSIVFTALSEESLAEQISFITNIK